MKKELGLQALDTLMVKWGLSNSDLVRVSTQQLTHKMVGKGRSGRRLTLNVQNKILTAIKLLRPDQRITLKELFNY